MKIDAVELKVRYSRFETDVLKGLSLSYETPQILSLLGVNGCGKSTLLKTLVGQLRAYHGSVLIDGCELHTIPAHIRAQNIAYVAQTHEAYFTYSCLEVAAFGRTPYLRLGQSPSEEDYDMALEALRRVGIAHLENRAYTNVSGGERQLVMLAAALAQNPQLLLLDEPTSHLDYGNQFRFLELLCEIHSEHIGIIMTTHYPDHALFLGGETAIVNRGVIADRGPSAEIITEQNLSALYGRTIRIVAHEGTKLLLPY